jgi:hypothetical protein
MKRSPITEATGTFTLHSPVGGGERFEIFVSECRVGPVTECGSRLVGHSFDL